MSTTLPTDLGPASVRILIADDSQIVRQGIKAILESAATYEICGEAADGTEAIHMAISLLPDIILLDVSMPGQDGLSTARHLRQELPNAKLIIMSQHDPTLLLPRAIEAGAHACVDKNNLDPELLQVIENIVRMPSVSLGQ